MDILWGAAAVILVIAFAGIALTYFLKRSSGKGYLAVSATSAIVAVWAIYASLLSINWPAVAVAWISREDREAMMLAIQPSFATIASGFPIAALACYLIYKLANAELRLNRLPLNSSAREIEEPGRSVGLLELASAHARYKLAGRVDKPLSNPGDDPFKLPDLPAQVEWPNLAADMLVQLEPNLLRDTFRHMNERTFFTLQESDVLDPTQTWTWVVRAVREGFDRADILGTFDAVFPATKQGIDRMKFVICSDASLPVDERVQTPKGLAVRFISFGALIEKTVDLTQYASSLIRRFDQTLVPGTNFTLRDCFVPLKAQSMTPRDEVPLDEEACEPPKDLLGVLAEWTRAPGVDHISVIGEFGQGKSTILLAFCANWARRWLQGERQDRIPLLIELRGKSPRRQAPDRFLAEWGDRYGLRGGALLSLIQAGRVTLIFEGFDEVQDAGLRYDRFEQFKALWAFSYPGAKIIFTGRPNFFLDTAEREKLLRSSRVARDAGLANTEVLSLLFLNEGEIDSALRHYPSEVRSEIVLTCARDEAFFDIAKRPSMLPVIGNQWSRIKSQLASQSGITSAAIIKYFIDFLYKRKDANRELGEYGLLPAPVRHYFTQRIAWKMVSNASRNTIDRDSFVSAVEEAFRDVDSEFRASDMIDPTIPSMIARLKESYREKPHSELIATLATDIRANGLLVEDPAGGRDNLYFPHKQYFEFILGQVFVDATRKETDPDAWARRLPRGELIRGVFFEPVSLFFAAGLLKIEDLSSYSIGNVVERVTATLVGAATALPLVIMALGPRKMRRNAALIRIVMSCPPYLRGLFSGRHSGDLGVAVIATVTRATTIIMLMMFIIYFPLLLVSERTFLGVSYFTWILAVSTPIFMGFSLRLARSQFYTIGMCYLVMELYRRGFSEQVLSKYGEKANAAVVWLVAIGLPAGAIELPASIVDAARECLDIDSSISGEE